MSNDQAVRDLIEINNIIFGKGAPLGSTEYFRIRSLAAKYMGWKQPDPPTERQAAAAKPEHRTTLDREPSPRNGWRIECSCGYQLAGIDNAQAAMIARGLLGWYVIDLDGKPVAGCCDTHEDAVQVCNAMAFRAAQGWKP